MPTDPNRDRDRALQDIVRSMADIAKSLKSIDANLKEAIKLIKRRDGVASFRNYQEGEEQNGASTPAGSAESEVPLGPYGSGTSQPYS